MVQNADLDAVMRGADAYKVAARAMDAMVRHKVWPTPANYETWLAAAANPASPLAVEIDRMIAAGETFTDSVCEALFALHVQRPHPTEAIRVAGEQLSRELDTVSQAIQAAHVSNETYGGVLADAGAELEGGNPSQLRLLIQGLTDATRQAEQQAKSLQRQLEESTSEVDKLRDNLAEVRRDAATDALTGLGNRKAFDGALDRAVAEAERTGRPLSLAVLDIDNFKRFNDTWGHQTGDQVLRFVANVIGHRGEGDRFAARYGGEEFALVFPGETALAAEPVLIEVLREIAGRGLRRRSTNEELGAVTVSAGLAELKASEGVSGLMDRADSALYASKRNGRNRVTNAGKRMVEVA